MSRSRTPQQLRRLAADLERQYPECRISLEHDSGKKWDLNWKNGPSAGQVKKALARAAPEAEVRLLRSYSMRAWALAGLRACLGGHVDPYSDGRTALDWTVEDDLAHVEAPETTAAGEDRLAMMAEALLAHAEGTRRESELLAPLPRHGVSWLLEPRRAAPGTAGPLTLSPAEHLTARYARGEDASQWRMRLRTLPVEELIDRARDDQDLDRVGRLAVLGLLEQMLRLWEAIEADAFAAARDAHAPGGTASWAQIGAVLGISRQAAHERGRSREAGTSSRMSRQA